MASPDLQRLFYRTANTFQAPLEDFLSEVLRIAILHDRRPLLRGLDRIPDTRWPTRSKDLVLDLVTDGGPVVQDVDTQYQLHDTEERDAGRLDLRIVLKAASGMTQEVWIEVKVDAPLTPRSHGRNQLDVYLDHGAAAAPPQPILLTLARDEVRDLRVPGFTWEELTESIEGEPDADRWWKDLVAFLRADGIAPSPLPERPESAPAAFISVFKGANQCLKQISGGAPMSLRWPAIEKAAIDGRHWFTAGPMSWGLGHIDGAWIWSVNVANQGYPSVTVPVDEVLAAARQAGLLELGWTPIDRQQRKHVDLFEKRRPFVGGESDLEVAAWFCQAFHELMDGGLFEPHFKRVQAKQAKEAAKSPVA